jgi:putative transposase
VIIAVLREHDAGAKAADLARKYGVSEATLYNWKSKHGGLDVSEAKRLKALEDENRKLRSTGKRQRCGESSTKPATARPPERQRETSKACFIYFTHETTLFFDCTLFT